MNSKWYLFIMWVSWFGETIQIKQKKNCRNVDLRNSMSHWREWNSQVLFFSLFRNVSLSHCLIELVLNEAHYASAHRIIIAKWSVKTNNDTCTKKTSSTSATQLQTKRTNEWMDEERHAKKNRSNTNFRIQNR